MGVILTFFFLPFYLFTSHRVSLPGRILDVSVGVFFCPKIMSVKVHLSSNGVGFVWGVLFLTIGEITSFINCISSRVFDCKFISPHVEHHHYYRIFTAYSPIFST